MFVFEKCTDLGDSWCFENYPRDEEDRDFYTGCDVFKIDKETGKTTYVYIGLPGDKFFDKWIDAEQIDISEYLKGTSYD
ncbi:MAG: hypothetical protein J5809_02655 [Selenomonadaceae bacterium]|nr:hypothetical protein [Selenomonadaceae bacterium]